MNRNIGIIGLGYVGLPLAYEFSKIYKTYGFDINEERINDLKEFNDNNLEINSNDLKSVLVDKNNNKNKWNPINNI